MQMPSVAELLNASGYSRLTAPLIQRAVKVLYGDVGANSDERDWAWIMSAANPLEAAEAALKNQWQSPAYLLRNMDHVQNAGYVASAAELTYRQMADRLNFTYNSSWSSGTAFEATSQLAAGPLNAKIATDIDARTPPTITLSSSNTGASLSLSHAGSLSFSVSGAAGSAGVGATNLSAGASVREGTLTVTRDNGQASTTSTYLYIGTSSAANLDYRSGATSNRLIVMGGGADTIQSGQGNDTIYGGDGNDEILGNQGTDFIYGQSGDDTVNSGQGNDTIYGGDGNDQLNGGSSGVDYLYGEAGDDSFVYETSNNLFTGSQLVDFIDGGTGTNSIILAGGNDGIDITASMNWGAGRITNVSQILAVSNGGQLSVSLNDGAYETGLRRIDLSGDTYTYINVNIINVSAETGSGNGYVLIGHAGGDSITGGAGADTIMGGAGNDTIDGGAGADIIRFGSVLVSGTAGDAAAGGGVSASVGADTLAFSPDDDTFELSETIFGVLGNGGSGVGATLNANQFATVSGIADALNGTLDTTGNGAIVYNAGNRALYFLEAGASNTATLQALLTAGTAVKIADISTPAITITAADFMVIA